MSRAFKIVIKVAIIAALAILLNVFGVVELCTVTGDSMYATLSDGTFGIAIPKSKYEYGDIITATIVYEGQECNIVKRVIGKVGDDIVFSNGIVLRNGIPLAEEYLSTGCVSEGASYHVDLGYYVLGDNRAISYDSRQCGALPPHSIRGKFYSVNGTYKGIIITGLFIVAIIIFIFV